MGLHSIPGSMMSGSTRRDRPEAGQLVLLPRRECLFEALELLRLDLEGRIVDESTRDSHKAAVAEGEAHEGVEALPGRGRHAEGSRVDEAETGVVARIPEQEDASVPEPSRLCERLADEFTADPFPSRATRSSSTTKAGELLSL